MKSPPWAIPIWAEGNLIRARAPDGQVFTFDDPLRLAAFLRNRAARNAPRDPDAALAWTCAVQLGMDQRRRDAERTAARVAARDARIADRADAERLLAELGL